MDYVLAETYRHFRSQVLELTASPAGVSDSTFGVLMETGYPEAVVTLVALSDGTASLCFSNGGGIIGAGQQERTSVAGRSLVAFAAHNFEHLVSTVDYPLPDPGHTRFYILTSKGVLMADAPENDFGENRHVLSPLFYSAQELIADIRTSDEVASGS